MHKVEVPLAVAGHGAVTGGSSTGTAGVGTQAVGRQLNIAAAAFETAVPGESITLTAAGLGAVAGGTSAGAAGAKALAVRVLGSARCRQVVLCSAGPPPAAADSCANRAAAVL